MAILFLSADVLILNACIFRGLKADGLQSNLYVMLKHSHKKRIVWKHGPNRPFYALMLRTKLY